jgi:hypothetical protein
MVVVRICDTLKNLFDCDFVISIHFARRRRFLRVLIVRRMMHFTFFLNLWMVVVDKWDWIESDKNYMEL